MATVLERFVALGLEHNRKILSKTGMRVSEQFQSECNTDTGWGRQLFKQKEEGKEIYVWDYTPHWVSRMDEIILDFVQNPFTDG